VPSRGVPRHLALILVGLALVVSMAAPAGAAASDQKIASSGLLKQGDVGKDWNRTPTSPANGFGPAGIAPCKKVTKLTRAKRTKRVVSDVYARGDAKVSTSVSVYRSPAAALSAFQALAGTSAQQCIQQVLSGELAKQASGPASARSVVVSTADAPTYGDQHAAYVVDADGTAGDGSHVGIKALLVVVQVRRAVLGSTFSGPSTPPPDAVARVLGPPVDRLVRAQRSPKKK
jgi:hypothetical protein